MLGLLLLLLPSPLPSHSPCIRWHSALSQQRRQKLSVRNALHLRPHDSPCPLVNLLVRKQRVGLQEELREAIVLADKEGVQGREPQLLVRSVVTCREGRQRRSQSISQPASQPLTQPK